MPRNPKKLPPPRKGCGRQMLVGFVLTGLVATHLFVQQHDVQNYVDYALGTTNSNAGKNPVGGLHMILTIVAGLVALRYCLFARLHASTPCIYSTAGCTIVAAVILHLPGLRCRVLYQQSQTDVMGAVVGSVTEGVFWLLFYTKVYSIAQQLLLPRDALALLTLISASLPWLVFSVAASIGDSTFQKITGGAVPDMWALADGYKHTKGHLQAFQNEGLAAILKIATFGACFLAATVVHGWGLCRYYYHKSPGTNNKSSTRCRQFHISNWLLLTTMLMALIAYQLGCWQPILHATFSLFGSYVFTLETVQVQEAIRVQNHAEGSRPNVLYLIHESTSGAYWLNQKRAVAMTPFFQSLRQSDDMYVFPRARTVSGDTCDAMTALVTGCLPITDQAKRMAFARSIATEFKQQGYQTASFSSRLIDQLKGGKWDVLVNYMQGNIDVAVDPTSANLTLIEPRFPSTDDRIMAQHFAEWSTNRSLAATEDPYFAMFYTFNTHWPWVDRGTGAQGVQKYYESFESLDGALQVIFDHLNSTNQLENTIVIGSGDHGEAYEAKRSRLNTWNPYVLHPLTYMYVPKQWLTEEERTTLRSNTERVISTLDLFPTAQHLAYGGNAQSTADLRNRSHAADATNDFESENCISGVDLLDVSIPAERVALSHNSISVPPDHGMMMGAISNLDRGLFVYHPVKLREMIFGNCTAFPVQSDHWYSQCIRDVTDADLAYWQEVLRGDNTTTLINHAGRNSVFMKAFLKQMEMSSSVSDLVRDP